MHLSIKQLCLLTWIVICVAPIHLVVAQNQTTLSIETGVVAVKGRAIRHLQLDTIYHPLLDQNQNIYTGNHSYGFIHTKLNLHPVSWVDFHVSPYLVVHDDRHIRNIHFTEMYGSLYARNVALDVGYTPIHWGMSQRNNLMFSRQMDPMPMVRLRTPNPIDLSDSWLSFLGQAEIETLYSMTDANRRYPDGHMVASKLAIYPNPNLMLHFAFSVLYGGEGAPTNNPLVIANESYLRSTDTRNSANRNFLFGIKWDIPRLGLTPYADMYIEDCCRLNFFNPRDSNYLAGIKITPLLEKRDQFWLNVEWVQTSNPTYVHHFSPTHNERIMGHPIGPDATGLYLSMAYQKTPTLQLGGLFATENRGRLAHASFYVANAQDNFTPITAVEPRYENPELRVRAEMYASWQYTPKIMLHSRLGFERVLNENYAFSNNHYNGVAQISAEVTF